MQNFFPNLDGELSSNGQESRILLLQDFKINSSVIIAILGRSSNLLKVLCNREEDCPCPARLFQLNFPMSRQSHMNFMESRCKISASSSADASVS